jgi:hypothetical protein
MEATSSSETSVETQWTTRRHIPEDDTLQNHHCENLKSYIFNLVYEKIYGQNYESFSHNLVTILIHE